MNVLTSAFRSNNLNNITGEAEETPEAGKVQLRQMKAEPDKLSLRYPQMATVQEEDKPLYFLPH